MAPTSSSSIPSQSADLQRDDGSVLTEVPGDCHVARAQNPDKGLLPATPTAGACHQAMDYAVSTMHMQGFSHVPSEITRRPGRPRQGQGARQGRSWRKVSP